MKITDYKLENDGTCKMYAGNGGLVDTYKNVDSMLHAQQLMDDHNLKLLPVKEVEVVRNVCTVVSQDRNHETINFMYFANNFHHDWMDSVWDKNTSMHSHLYEKWQNLCKRNEFGGTANFFTFFMQLDESNKDILCDWISENYSYRLD